MARWNVILSVDEETYNLDTLAGSVRVQSTQADQNMSRVICSAWTWNWKTLPDLSSRVHALVSKATKKELDDKPVLNCGAENVGRERFLGVDSVGQQRFGANFVSNGGTKDSETQVVTAPMRRVGTKQHDDMMQPKSRTMILGPS